MAVIKFKSLAVLSLIFANIILTHCDSEAPYIDNVDNTKADLLLRGSEEQHDIEDSIPKHIKKDNATVMYLQVELANTDGQIKKYTTEEVVETKDTVDFKTTTDLVQTSTNADLAEALNTKKTDDLFSYADDNQKVEYDDLSTTISSDRFSSKASSNDQTETTTEYLSTTSDSTYSTTESLPSTPKVEIPKPETSSMPTTKTSKGEVNPRIADEVEIAAPNVHSVAPVVEHVVPNMESGFPRVSGYDEEHGYSQRVPKTENVEPRLEDKRHFEAFAPAYPKPSARKSETLKNWLEDSWLRPPAALLVPLRPLALTRALAVWNDLIGEGLNITEIVIVGYDSNGVIWRSRHNLQPSRTNKQDKTVAEALSKLILKYQAVDENTSDGILRALTTASKVVPYDSALFVVTDKGAGDYQRRTQAIRALVEKRLKVYILWTDPTFPSEQSAKQLEELSNISRHTEGEVLPYSMQVMDVEDNSADHTHWDHMKAERKAKTVVEEQYDTLLVRRGGGEAISLGLPVENGVSLLRIFIEGLVEHAVLYPPNDAPQIDLYNLTSIYAFSPDSRTDGMSPRDVYLAFPGNSADYDILKVIPSKLPATVAPSAPTVGMWHLSVRCDACDYRLCVTARAQIHLYVTEEKDKLKIRVIGPVYSIRESMLVDEYGTQLAKLPFSYQPMAADGQELPIAGISTELNAVVPLPTVKGSRVYAKVVGRDVKGEPFTRLAGPLNQEVRTSRSAAYTSQDSSDLERAESYNSKAYNQGLRYNETSIVPYNRAVSQVANQRGSLLTAVQIGLSSRLYGAPGDNLQLHFEVTNYRDQDQRFAFQAVGELRFLTGIRPQNQLISAGQTANVIVSLSITNTAQPGARDFITFTASGQADQVSISAYVYVTNPGESSTDVWAPELRHVFQGSCIGRQDKDCAQHAWSTTVYARDAVSGLLRLSSSPVGLMYDSNFISGTREQVVATYRATCCAPRVIVTAVDAQGNANSYVVDISNYVSEAGVAAIVLGVLLFIALLALVVFLIYWCVKRHKDSRELPYTASTRRDLS